MEINPRSKKQNIDMVLQLLRCTYIGQYATAKHGDICTNGDAEELILAFGDKLLVKDIIFNKGYYVVLDKASVNITLPIHMIGLEAPTAIFRVFDEAVEENQIGSKILEFTAKDSKIILKVANILQDDKKQLYNFAILIQSKWYYFSVRKLPFFYQWFNTDGENVNPPAPLLQDVANYFAEKPSCFFNDFFFTQNFKNTFTTK